MYQAYGQREVVQQMLLSVLTLRGQYPGGLPCEVRIYTDQVAELSAFFSGEPGVRLVAITAAQIRQWRGSIDFVHRVKLELLREAALTITGTLVYLDTDTFFTAPPMPVFEQVSDAVSLMHIRESTMSEPISPLFGKVGRFVKRRTFTVAGSPVRIPVTTAMWNAGVIGVSPRNALLFTPMIELTDQLYGGYQKHVMEQLAVSFYLHEASEIRPADAVIGHYWRQKPEYTAAIASFLARHPTFQSALQAMAEFPWPPPPAESPKRKWYDLGALFR